MALVKKLRAGLAGCAKESKAYGVCVGNAMASVEHGTCAAEFAVFKACFAKHIRP